MFDIWMGDIELTTAVLVFSIIVLLPIQLLLCFRIKSKVIRLLPIPAFYTYIDFYFYVHNDTRLGWSWLCIPCYIYWIYDVGLRCGLGYLGNH